MATTLPLFAAAAVAGLFVAASAARAQDVAPYQFQDSDSFDEDEDSSADEKTATDDPVRKQAIEMLVQHYLAMYSEHLQSKDWIVRAMAVIGLSPIDDPRISEKLVAVMQEDKTPLVQVYAWEALFARHKSLSDEQKKAWKECAKELAAKGHLRGDLRVGLIQIMQEEGPTDENVKLFGFFFDNTNAMDPSDNPTLIAMRRCLARWKDPRIIQKMIEAMGDINSCWRAETLLQNLNSGVPSSRSLMQLDSQTIWERTRTAWVEWFKATNLTNLKGFTGPFYGEDSVLLAKPKRIKNPADPEWRKDLELRPLRLKDLDVAFVVDSTGSMTDVIRWIQRDVVKMMKAFGRISREPRIGIVFYRDHGDEYLTRVAPLTGDGESLVRAIASIEAKGGDDIPEAVYEAIGTAVKKLKWTSNNRVVITVGDAPPHDETKDKLVKLIKEAAEKGYRFHFIKARTEWGSGAVAMFDELAEWGQGSSVWVSFQGDPGAPQTVEIDDQEVEIRASRDYLARVASADYGEAADRQVVANVLRSVLNADYHDRVDPFVAILLEYVDEPVSEKRRHFGPAPAPRTHTDGPHRVQPGPPPNPQQ
ncbi:MAG: VWA domain-containing protein [Planctomycetes bacterium]|nr:VWA domain-containing protein [Planctomycetota bacterium]